VQGKPVRLCTSRLVKENEMLRNTMRFSVMSMQSFIGRGRRLGFKFLPSVRNGIIYWSITRET
jgi:hypothetical protein